MSDMDKKQLEEMVRKVLGELLAQNSGPGFERQVDPSGVMAIKTSTVKTEPFPFDIGPEAQKKVAVKDLLNLEESPRLGLGVMEMDHTAFKWTLNYDEVDYVIEGTLEIIIDGRKVVGQPGDCIFIPAKSTIEFSSPGFSRFVYVVYPANWAEQ